MPDREIVKAEGGLILKLNRVTTPGQQRRACATRDYRGGRRLIGGNPELQAIHAGIKTADLVYGAAAGAHLAVLQGLAAGSEGHGVAAPSRHKSRRRCRR